MDFPRNHQKLTEIFKKGKAPLPHEFEGEYWVDMLTGIPSLRRFSHRKRFFVENGVPKGINIVFRNTVFGHFGIEPGDSPQLNGQAVVILNYDQPQNSFVTNRLRDYVVCVEPRKAYLGRLQILIGKKSVFGGYFSLVKIQ